MRCSPLVRSSIVTATIVTTLSTLAAAAPAQAATCKPKLGSLGCTVVVPPPR